MGSILNFDGPGYAEIHDEFIEILYKKNPNIKYYKLFYEGWMYDDFENKEMEEKFSWYLGEGWYWWDETQTNAAGPYETYEKAEDDYINYAENLSAEHRKEVK